VSARIVTNVEADQLLLSFPPDPVKPCEHEYGFTSYAEVPGGVVCSQCGEWICRDLCLPNEPEILGYVSACWEWHYKRGKPWTRDDGAQE
jgi:hypothetical protein